VPSRTSDFVGIRTFKFADACYAVHTHTHTHTHTHKRGDVECPDGLKKKKIATRPGAAL